MAMPTYLSAFEEMIDALYSVTSLDTITHEEYLQNQRAFFAIVHVCDVIVESVPQIPEQIRAQNPQIPWQKWLDLEERVFGLRAKPTPNDLWSIWKHEFRPALLNLEELLRKLALQAHLADNAR